MQKYGGKLIHARRDEQGLIEVVEDRFERTLHFGTEAKQSGMDLRDPVRLALSYTRAMTAALLFQPAPRKALLIGLGGGSLAKFLLHHFPDCSVDVVEFRAAVHKVAREWFAVPDDPRLTVHIDDGAKHLWSLPDDSDYDLLLVDAFLHDGIASSVCGTPFFDNCRRVLSRGGVLSMNLWTADYITAEDLLDGMAYSFGAPALRLPVEGKDNVIGLAGTGGLDRRQLQKLGERAKALEDRLDVEYPALLRRLRKANGGGLFGW